MQFDSIYTILKDIDSGIHELNAGWIQTTLSTLAGVIAGIFITEAIQRYGTIKAYCDTASAIFYSKPAEDIYSSTNVVKANENPDSALFEYDITISNTAKIRRYIMNIKIEIRISKNKYEFQLQKKKASSIITANDYYSSLLIEGNSIVQLSGLVTVGRDVAANIAYMPKVFLKYKNEKSKVKTIKIYEMRL